MIHFDSDQLYRYLHEPLPVRDSPVPLEIHKEAVGRLVRRIHHSNGGSLLITGMRGVGKTSVVRHALDWLASADGRDRAREMADKEYLSAMVSEDVSGRTMNSPPRSRSEIEYVPVHINLARPISPKEFLYQAIRRSYESLADQDTGGALCRAAREHIALAYMRTSYSISKDRAQGGIGNVAAAAGSIGVAPKILATLVGALSGATGLLQRSASVQTLLPYDVSDAEHDFSRFLHYVSHPPARKASLWRRLWHRNARRRGAAPPKQVRMLFILDELDKMTEHEEGEAALDAILSSMKNLLTAHGAFFVFIAGMDVHHRVAKDMARGHGLYEGVFSYALYVPCSWQSAQFVLKKAFAPAESDGDDYECLRGFLDFRARGVLRRAYQELNRLIEVDSRGCGCMLIPIAEFRRVRLLAALDELIRDVAEQEVDGGILSDPAAHDLYLSAFFRGVEWVISRSFFSFTRSEFMQEQEHGGREAIGMKAPRIALERLFDGLVEHRWIVRTGGPVMDNTVIGRPESEEDEPYVLSKERILGAMRGPEPASPDIATPSDAAVAGLIAPAASGHAYSQPSDRYEIIEEIGRGGMSRVYEARDTRLNRVVAIKSPFPHLMDREKYPERLLREIHIASQLRHPNLVSVLDTHDVDGIPQIVMEFIRGRPLEHFVNWAGASDKQRLPHHQVIGIGMQICDALGYLRDRGIVRIDLKPSNIILADTGRPVIVDFGIARIKETGRSDTITRTGEMLGTPQYVAPEAVQDSSRVDERADQYALGVTLFGLLAGGAAFAHGDGDGGMLAIFNAIMSGDVDFDRLKVSEPLQEAIKKSMAVNPDERYDSPESMRQALASSPEATPAAQL